LVGYCFIIVHSRSLVFLLLCERWKSDELFSVPPPPPPPPPKDKKLKKAEKERESHRRTLSLGKWENKEHLFFSITYTSADTREITDASNVTSHRR
jgi:hypothetical protein